MAISPQYAATPRCGMAQISTANPNRDGTGAIATVLAAGSNGSRVDTVIIKAPGSTTAGMVRLYVNDGTDTRLFDEQYVEAISVGSTAPGFMVILNLDGLILPNGFSLRASTQNAEAFNILAFGGDF